MCRPGSIGSWARTGDGGGGQRESTTRVIDGWCALHGFDGRRHATENARWVRPAPVKKPTIDNNSK